MKIKLDERYYIEDDRYGFVLRDGEQPATKINAKGGKDTTYAIIGSYGTLPQATQGYLRVLMNNNIVETDMKGYIAEYQKQVDRILGLLPELERKHT